MFQGLREGYSSRESGFRSQDNDGDPKPSVAPVWGDIIPSPVLHEHISCMWYTDIHLGTKPPHIKYN